MKTPSFWSSKNLTSTLLLPFGCIYGFLTSLRMSIRKPQKIYKPVICIGNLTAGGTGKTPVAVSIAKLLQDNGKNPFFISRGYKGKLKNVMVSNRHSASEVGDEPLLLAKQAPVVINPNRYEAAVKAVNHGAGIIIMDDGFQNPSLYKDLSFIVIDGEVGFGNKRCIPSGPLRESLHSGFKRADALIIIGKDKFKTSKETKLPVFNGTLVPVNPNIKNKNIIAFAGIGRPQKFYNSLKECGFNIEKTYDFSDHHHYNTQELKVIINESKLKKAEIFTTSKDFVKIPQNLQKHFKVLEIQIQWQDENKLLNFILNKI